ncbi:MAG: N-acetyltransferase family protein [Bacillota bacterium]
MKIRTVKQEDFPVLAAYEMEIAEISFGDEAVTDPDFHLRKLEKALPKEKNGMMVLEADGKPAGWLWMTPRTNSVSGETYVNFKSFYIEEGLRGTEWPEKLLKSGLEYCRAAGAERIIGKVHVKNLPMRALYKKCGFEPTHMTMELALRGNRK